MGKKQRGYPRWKEAKGDLARPSERLKGGGKVSGASHLQGKNSSPTEISFSGNKADQKRPPKKKFQLSRSERKKRRINLTERL